MQSKVRPETLRAAWERAREGFAEVGEDGRLLNVNAAFAEIVGYSPIELQGKTFQEITHPDDVTADAAMVEQVVAGKIESYPMQKRYLTKHSGVKWVRLLVSRIPDDAPPPEDGTKRPVILLGQVMEIENNTTITVEAPDPWGFLKNHPKKVATALVTLSSGVGSGVYYLKGLVDAQNAVAERLDEINTLLQALVK